MSRRKRTSQRRIVDPEIIDEARKLINEGKSKRHVADQLGIAESTLRSRLKREGVPVSLGRFKCTFTPEMENNFLEYVVKLDALFFGITPKNLRRLAFDFAEKNNVQNQFNKQFQIAGKDWLRGFFKRHPSLALRQPTSTSIARAMGFNKPQVDRFYSNLSDLYDKYHFQPHKIFNMDESGFSTVPNKPPKVISTKGKRCVNKISSAERGQNVTVVCAMSASGQYIPPAFIYKRKRMKAELIDNAPPSSIGMTSDSSFITSELFLHWLHHFKSHATPTKTDPVLLILDNHSSHCSLQTIDFCRQNNIILLSLPPHSSHKIQPLDRCFFSSLKKYYAAECENWMRNHPGRTITTFQVATIFAPAYSKTASVANAIEGFKVTGIHPFNNNLFSETDYLASSVTERPLVSSEDVMPTNFTENSDNGATTSTQISPHRVDERELLSVESELLELARQITEPSEPIPSTSTSSTVTLTQLSPYPKSSVLRLNNKRSKRSEVLSSSPYKKQLEDHVANKKPIVQRKRKEVHKKPKTAPKKKSWACPGCAEKFIEPIVEDWIECTSCHNWWHDKCTAYMGHGHYICDVCN